jgi:hypothetical protein
MARSNLLLSLFITLSAVAGASFADAGPYTPPASAGFAKHSVLRTMGEVRSHLAKNPSSPLYLLSPTDRAKFVDSLVFTGKGVGSFAVKPLKNVSPDDALSILSLFGLQAEAAQLTGRNDARLADRVAPLTVARPPRPIGKSCVASPGGKRGRCIEDPGYRCSHLCN